MPRHALAGLLLGGLVGLVVGLLALDPQFIFGTGGKWIRPENDYNAYLVAWNYFLRDEWRLPIFSVPSMGYPEGGNVLFNDGLPLTALITKVVYGVSGAIVNPFGWWILLTFVLQGALAARVVQSTGVRSIPAAVAAAALAVVATAFVWRMGHTALSTHGVILWAIAIYFASMRDGRARVLESSLLLAVTLLVNAYLFVIVFALTLVTLAALWQRRQLAAADVRRFAVGVAAVVALALVSGYGLVLRNPATMKSAGFDLYSWNLATLLVPPEGVFGAFRGITRDATHGQYEGEAFIGRGALLLLALALLSAPRRVAASIRAHAIFCAGLAALAVYAASNRVYAGSVLVVSYDLPPVLLDLANYFRASGRFIWPLAYSLTVLPLACLFRWWRPAAAIAAAVIAVGVQLSDAAPVLQYRRAQTQESQPDLIDAPRLATWLSAHHKVWQYPSWDCGGLVGTGRGWPSEDAHRELQLQLAAAERAMPMNSIYASRAMKDCAVEAGWAANPSIDDGVLYVIGPAAARAAPLSALTSSPACVTLEWAVVCSSAWLRR
jgi:Family of unknown function (DUF6311)